VITDTLTDPLKFADVKVLPTYGDFKCVITWTMADKRLAGDYVVKKSPDGVGEWSVMASGRGIDAALDTDLFSTGGLFQNFYQVFVTREGKTGASPIVGTFGAIQREIFGAARYIMNMEYSVLRRFSKLWLYKGLWTTEPCKECTDPATGQGVGTSLCETCWGTAWEGGYAPPVTTYARFMSQSNSVQNDSQEGTGSTSPIYRKVRMLSFPMLRKDDMLVEPLSDQRYLVESCEHGYLNGQVPTMAMVQMSLLNTRDVRYKIPMPPR
jgi:hypothetical protein